MNEPYDLVQLAKDVMRQRGLEPDFSKLVLTQVNTIDEPAKPQANVVDYRALKWCSIDNDDSRDLDQLTYGHKNADHTYTIYIAIADVDELVVKSTPVDTHAKVNTTSVYTPAIIFPMLPEKLSTNLTSLNQHQDRLAVVIKITLDAQGTFLAENIEHAHVHNYAQLAYSKVGAWLEGKGPLPEKISFVDGLELALKEQNEAAQILRQKRQLLGSLTLESPNPDAKVIDKEIVLQLAPHNLAHQLIENFMIAGNTVMAHRFRNAKISSLRRVVRKPKRWDRIVEIALELGEFLPETPDSKALDEFLMRRKEIDREAFPDLSLAIIKLLGSGEYVVENPGEAAVGHFGLAITQYTHSTAPNRRYPDLITQRQCKAHLNGFSSPYNQQDLRKLAEHCTQQEDAAQKVERHLTKSAAALLLSSQLGQTFKGIVTGSSEKGTWVRVFVPPVEGKLVSVTKKVDVGDRVTVKLVEVDIPRGFIDFIQQ